MKITHYLTIQVCKRVFFDPDYGIMRSDEPLFISPYLKIKPLVLLGVSVDNLPLDYTQYFHQNDNISLSGFLKKFWEISFSASSSKAMITGMPDKMVIDHRCKEFITNRFYEWLSANNIEFEFSESKNKTAISKFRQHQKYPHVFVKNDLFNEKSYKTSEEDHALHLDVLNESICQFGFIHEHRKHLPTIEAYAAKSDLAALTIDPISNDVALENLKPLESKIDQQLVDASWVPSDSQKQYPSFGYLVNRTTANESDGERYYKKTFISALKALPESQWPAAFTAHQIDLIIKLRKNRYKDTTDFDDDNYISMSGSLGIETDYSRTSATLAFDTTKLNKSEVAELWDTYSGGGDVRFSCELLVSNGFWSTKEAEYRVFYLASHAGHNIFFVCPINSNTCQAFDDDQCINFMMDKKYTPHQIQEDLNINDFCYKLLNNRQYLLFMADRLEHFYSTILDY